MARIYDPEREAELVAACASHREKADKLREQMAAMQDEVGDSKWTPEKSAHYSVLMNDLTLAENDYTAADSALQDMLFHKPAEGKVEEGSMGDIMDRAIRKGRGGLTPEERAMIDKDLNDSGLAGMNPDPDNGHGIRVTHGISARQMQVRRQLAVLHGGRMGAITSDSDSGSNFIDTETMPTVVDTLAQYGGALQVCGRLASASSAPVRIPQEDAASQKGVCVSAQGTTAADLQTPNPGFIEFTNYTFHSQFIEITLEMIDDVGFDLVGWILSQCQRRIGRIMNEKFTKGTGTNEPTGFMTSPKEHVLSSQSAISFPADLIDLMYVVNEAYLQGEKGPGGLPAGSGIGTRDGMIGFTFNRATEGYLRKALDSDGRPLWQPGITLGVPDMINGYPYVTNNDIDTIAAGKLTVAFGNFGYHKLRLQDSIALYNFWDSATAARHARRIIGFARADSDNVLVKDGNSKWPAHAALKMAA